MDATETFDKKTLTNIDCYIICVEQDNSAPTWLRIQPHDNKLIVVESSSYGNPVQEGYSMIFNDSEEYGTWLKDRSLKGWRITFVGNTEPLSDSEIITTRDNIINKLKKV